MGNVTQNQREKKSVNRSPVGMTYMLKLGDENFRSSYYNYIQEPKKIVIIKMQSHQNRSSWLSGSLEYGEIWVTEKGLAEGDEGRKSAPSSKVIVPVVPVPPRMYILVACDVHVETMPEL